MLLRARRQAPNRVSSRAHFMETPPIEARPAATVVLMRDAANADGLEVLLLRRNSQLAFYGGAWGFPGGRIDDADGPAQDLELRARRAAVRELREEAAPTAGPSAHAH